MEPAAAWGPLLLSPSSVVTFPVSTEGQMAEHLQTFEGFFADQSSVLQLVIIS